MKCDRGFYIKDSQYSSNSRFFQFVNYDLGIQKHIFIMHDEFECYISRYNIGVMEELLNEKYYYYIMLRNDGILVCKSKSSSMNGMLAYSMYVVNKIMSEYSSINLNIIEGEYESRSSYDLDYIYISNIINDYVFHELGNVVTNHYGCIKIVNMDKKNKSVTIKVLGTCMSCSYKSILLNNISKHLKSTIGYCLSCV